jgi:predicted CXXCH cytochrome family protein
MKNHAWRPLIVVIAAVALLLLVRAQVVPSDFGVNGKNFTYGFHRKGSIDDWQAVKVKYRGKEYCRECHEEKVTENLASPHKVIQCENCHGPAIDHPDNPALLTVDKSRGLCLRCHAGLPYPQSQRSKLPAIDPLQHNPDQECVGCHNPHQPNLEAM